MIFLKILLVFSLSITIFFIARFIFAIRDAEREKKS